MPSYVREIRIETEYDEQPLVAVLKPLRYADALRLNGVEDEQAIVEYARLLPEYIVSLTELHDADGAPVPMEAVLGNAFYAALVARLLRGHVDAATLKRP